MRVMWLCYASDKERLCYESDMAVLCQCRSEREGWLTATVRTRCLLVCPRHNDSH